MEGLISLIVQVYNKEDKVEKCIKSILNQTYKKIEIIMIDDGSTDKTLEICRKIEKTDNRIKLIYKENEGVSATRNLGIEIAKGEFIQFVDSDDELERNMCELLVKKMQKEHLDMVMCGYKVLKGEKVIEKELLCEEKEEKEKMDYLYENYFLNPIWNKIYLHNKIKNKFMPNLSIGEDLLFNLDYMQNINKIGYIEKALYKYKNNDSNTSLSKKYQEEMPEIALKMYFEMKKFYIEKLKNNEYTAIKKVLKENSINIFSSIANNNQFDFTEKKQRISKILENSNYSELYDLCLFKSLEEIILNRLIKKEKMNSLVYFFKVKNVIRKIILKHRNRREY